mmetsp:Transcript_37591/g.72826  ORF Transcript_37591/g.72826 Transcript_37591/m.72826 type:complete len:83 (-) Transcript_37591:1793-2041(-)
MWQRVCIIAIIPMDICIKISSPKPRNTTALKLNQNGNDGHDSICHTTFPSTHSSSSPPSSIIINYDRSSSIIINHDHRHPQS